MTWHPKAQVWSSESELVEVLRAAQKFPDVFIRVNGLDFRF